MQLKAVNLGFRYGDQAPWVLRHLDFAIEQGERVGLVGPSGCGKTTLARLLAGYERPSEGEVLLDQCSLPQKGINPVQLIYQHPEKAINPRWRMKKVLAEAHLLRPDIMADFGIKEEWLNRFPRELSGGELQRFCVARSLLAGTKFLIADEISTMLDVITQAQVWEKILKEVTNRNLGLIVVTHNQHLAQRVCQRFIKIC